MATQRDVSRQDWQGNNTLADINAGSLQRIADACELMAKNYKQLVDERDRYKLWYENNVAENRRMVRTIGALRGVITRLKNKYGVSLPR